MAAASDGPFPFFPLSSTLLSCTEEPGPVGPLHRVLIVDDNVDAAENAACAVPAADSRVVGRSGRQRNSEEWKWIAYSVSNSGRRIRISDIACSRFSSDSSRFAILTMGSADTLPRSRL